MLKFSRIIMLMVSLAVNFAACDTQVFARGEGKGSGPVAVNASPASTSAWEIGIGPGGVSPLADKPFFRSLRPTAGFYIDRRLSSSLGLGLETSFGFNTSGTLFNARSNNVVDHSYLGLYATVDMLTLLKGAPVNGGFRRFTIEPVAGLGWLHAFSSGNKNYNYLAAKVGVNFNFALSGRVSLGVKPAVMWRLTPSSTSTNAFNVNRSAFSLQATVGYSFGPSLGYIPPYDRGEVDMLNGQVNTLRSELEAQTTQVEKWKNRAADLETRLEAASKPQPQVVREVRDNLNSTRYIFFGAGSSRLSSDQQPNVGMIASYMRSHPRSTVDIKGYASSEGNADANRRLALRRAEAVKDALVSRYGIASLRITATGAGIGRMFDQPSWNRVSVCTLSTPAEN